MGQDGYMDIARRLMIVAERMKNGINAIEVYIFWHTCSMADEPCILSITTSGAVCVWDSPHDNSLIQLFR